MDTIQTYGVHELITPDTARLAAEKATYTRSCLTTFKTLATGELTIDTSLVQTSDGSLDRCGCQPRGPLRQPIDRDSLGDRQATEEGRPAPVSPTDHESFLHEDRVTTGISPQVLALLPAVLARPHVVLRDPEFYLLRPGIFTSAGTWLGGTKACPLGALLESWLVTGSLALTAEQVVNPDRRSPDDPLPYRRIFIYRASGSGLSGSHIARGIDPDTGERHGIGVPSYETRLPGSFHHWHKRLQTIGEHLPLWLRDEQKAVDRLKSALGVQ